MIGVVSCSVHHVLSTPAFIVIRNREILGLVPVDVDLAIVLVRVEGAGDKQSPERAVSFPSIITGEGKLIPFPVARRRRAGLWQLAAEKRYEVVTVFTTHQHTLLVSVITQGLR